MIYDLQRANMWKRISAYLLDAILLGMVVVGFAFLLSGIVAMIPIRRSLRLRMTDMRPNTVCPLI